MQSLKLELFSPAQFQHQGCSVGIMGGKLRVNDVLFIQQLRGTHLVAQVGIGLACEDRVIRITLFLGKLDLAIPVSTFYQSYHQLATRITPQFCQPLGHQGCTLAVCLQHKSQAIPSHQLRITRQGFENIQGNIQPVCLFRVNREAETVALCFQRQFAYARQHLVHHPCFLYVLVTWMQCG